jgi:mRNA-degrading endonuclease toxin of MazEF toxin-antitoxin module
VISASIEQIDPYFYGSIWHWKTFNGGQSGVPLDERLVLVVSNDSYNKNSTDVNCVTITHDMKNYPFYVPIFIAGELYAQCNQIHTVFKDELYDYVGSTPLSTMREIKKALRKQLFLAENKDTSLILKMHSNQIKMQSEIMKITAFIEKLSATQGVAVSCMQTTASQVEMHNETAQTLMSLPTPKKRSAPNAYTEEEKTFIIAENNSTDELIKRFGFKNKKAACAMRSHLRRAELKIKR